MSEMVVGNLYRVPWSTNPHRLEKIGKAHCQLHGDQIGVEYTFRKKRNSYVRPWGSCSVVTDLSGVVLWEPGHE